MNKPTFVRCASVTTGGKSHFFYSPTLRQWVVWNRAMSRWTLRSFNHGLVAVFLSDRAARDYAASA